MVKFWVDAAMRKETAAMAGKSSYCVHPVRVFSMGYSSIIIIVNSTAFKQK